MFGSQSQRVFDPKEYELVDFGGGRKLERFGGELLDRPSPAADGHSITTPDVWTEATARFDSEAAGKGRWHGPLASRIGDGADDQGWSVRYGETRLQLQLSASGNVGLFPEHGSTWDWIGDQVRRCQETPTSAQPRVLNLFAYTGGASLAAAIAGAEVTHVDSSGPTVAWARRNAEVSGVGDLPIRWIVDDALKFVARECRRGNSYDGIIADPPTYGHGPKGRAFKFAQHLDDLLDACGQLLNQREGSTSAFMLFSCHTPGFGRREAALALASVVPEGARVVDQQLQLHCADGRSLDAGIAARWGGQDGQR